MIIKNFTKLSKNRKKKTALQILEAGLRESMPEKPLRKFVKRNKIVIGKRPINLSEFENTYLVAFGKAAASMVKTVNNITEIKEGIVVIPKGSKPKTLGKKFKILQANHPIPDKSSVRAANTVVSFLKSKTEKDFIIFLVSGGGSALLCLPNHITLKQKIRVNEVLFKSGAKINELNCIRKHLSKIKGGKLVEKMKCKGISLVISDVVGNDLSSIASGTTYCDKTTFNDSLKIIKKYSLDSQLPKKVLTVLKQGFLGQIPETPKKSKVTHCIVLDNSYCLKAMTKKARELGLQVNVNSISGDVENVAKRLSSLVLKRKNYCLIFGGETTVNVKGKGKGGRNQELVLRLTQKLQKSKPNFVIASLGTDGIDGNTIYAGALADNFITRPSKIQSYLRNSNSSSFFQRHGGLIKTGYTGTNVMDIGLILV